MPGSGKYMMIYEQGLPYWEDGGDFILIPLNIMNMHWALITIDKRDKIAAYHDSLGCMKGYHGMEFLECVLNFMRQYDMKQNGNNGDEVRVIFVMLSKFSIIMYIYSLTGVYGAL